MQAITLEVILRAVFGVADAGRRERLRGQLADLLGSTASAGLQFSVLLSRRLGGPDPLAAPRGAHGRDRRDSCSPRSPSAGPTRGHAAARDDICSLLVAARFEDGGGMRTARSATS